jgi:tetratricopeptide (TPR) repeat protein
MYRFAVLAVAALSLLSTVSADEGFDRLLQSGKYQEAIDYADQKIDASSRTADIWVKLAEANEKIGLTEKALACYMVSWRLNPKDYASLVGAARIYNKLGQPENAMDMAKKALDQQFSGEASWEYAKACIDLKRPADAKKALEKVIETDPANLVANRELGQIYYDDRQYAQAIPMLMKAYQAKPDPEVAFKIGKCHLESNNAAAGVDFLKKTIEQRPAIYEAGLMLARAYFSMGKYLAAASEYSRIDRKIAFEPMDYYKMAVSFEESGKNAEAAASYRKAIESFGASKSSEAVRSREKAARADMASGNFAGALVNLQFISSADPSAKSVKDVYFLLADAYSGQKNTLKAIENLETAISLDKTNIEAYARLADLYRQNSMHDKAKKTYETMMALRPDDPGVYMILGEYNQKAGKYSEALDYFNRSNNLAKSASALEGMAVCARALGQWDKARDAAESALATDQSLTASREVLAEAYVRSGMWREAIPYLEAISGKYPSQIKYWEQLATCYDKTGSVEKRAAADARIISIDSKNTESRMRHSEYSMKKGDQETAYKLYKELSALTPKNASVFKNLYTIASQRKEKEAAALYLKSYLFINPSDAESQRDLGDLQYEKKDYDGALVSYRMAIKINPAIKGFYKRYAEIVIAKGQQAEVINALTGVIKTGEADVGTYTTLGMIYHKKGDFRSAVDMYQKALQLEPQNTDALIALGDCQAAMGSINDAVISYEQAVMMNPKSGIEYKALGDLYIKQKKTEQAINAFKKYLDSGIRDEEIARRVGMYLYDKKSYPDARKYMEMVSGTASIEPAFMFAYGIVCFETGDSEKAVLVLKNMIAKNPKAPSKSEALLMIARSYEKKNDKVSAASYYGQYLDAGARNADVAFLRANMEEGLNQSIMAEKYYEANIVAYPSDYRNYLSLGLIYSKKKETSVRAVTLLRKVTSLADTIPNVWLELARVYGKMGKTVEELDAYRQYIRKDPQNVEANVRVGLVLVEQGKTSEGMIYLETANTLKPGDIQVMIALAGGYLATKRINEAESLLLKARAAKPDNMDIRNQLVKLYMDKGESKKALDEIKEVVKVNRDTRLLLTYAKLLASDGKFKEAEDAIEDIRASDPENVETLMTLASIQRTRKKFDEAVETYKEIMYIDQNYVPAIFERAETYMQQNKPQWAQKFYERTLRSDPKHGPSELGLARLAKLRSDEPAYKMHVTRAMQMSPDNKEVQEEYRRSQR